MIVDIATVLSFNLALRWSRVLRPLVLIARARPLRTTASQVIKTLPRILQFYIVILVIMIIWGLVGSELFRNAYQGVYSDDSFSTPIRAMLATYVLLSTSNYPDVLYVSCAAPSRVCVCARISSVVCFCRHSLTALLQLSRD